MRSSPFWSRLVPLCTLAALAACESATELPVDMAPSFAVLGGQDASGSTEVRYMVIARENSMPESLADDVAALGGRIVGELPQIGILFATSADADFASEVSGIPTVQAVAPDLLLEFDDPTTDDGLLDHGSLPGAGFFDALTWGIDAVGAPEAWAAGNRGAGVRVAVLDAGIDPNHPDLAPNINAALSRSFVPCLYGPNCDGAVEDWRVTPGFYFNHGTHVSGTIAATGDLGVTGVAPEAELVVVKVCTEYFNACFTSSIMEGLVYAADAGADLANMSLGGLRRMRNDWVVYCRSLDIPASVCGRIARENQTFQDDYVQVAILGYQRAFEYAFRGGTTVITSAGNSALDADRSKDIVLAFADFPHTIAISALGPVGWCGDPSTSTDGPAYYTNTGRSAIDFAAPGGNFYGFFQGLTDPCAVGPVTRAEYVFDGVFSTIPGGWAWAQGTSMAAPHATGIAALLIAGNGGSMSPPEVERALAAAAVDLGSPGQDPIYGAGKVSVAGLY